MSHITRYFIPTTGVVGSPEYHVKRSTYGFDLEHCGALAESSTRIIP